jgi:cyclopropane fatty-acyl-phospholipid synthase-like methyltransferase
VVPSPGARLISVSSRTPGRGITTVKKLTDLVVFHDRELAARYANDKIPMSTLFEAYLDEAVDIADMDAFIEARNDVVTWSLTADHWKFLVTRMIPEVTIHSLAQDKRIVREHYDRGDDFFEAFLGDRMVYTAGFFRDENESLEQGQDNKLDLVCRKLLLRPGDEMLDIGCGWGTLAMHAAKNFGARATGVTISKNQTAFGNARISKAGLSDHAAIECMDYREIPRRQYDRISSLEMVEHVGVKNLVSFYEQVRDLLADDGLFLLQWTGLRRGLRPEDLIWGLFMNKYIFPGADASLPPAAMLSAMEKAGWETHTVENIGIHYTGTLRRWHDNWLSNKAEIVAKYGERWFRIWNLFLPWSAIVGEQGNAGCFQVVLNKNIDGFDRTRWIGRRAPVVGDRMSVIHAPAPAAAAE